MSQLFSRSGTLTYKIASMLSRAGIGQRAALGVGGDPLVGYDFINDLEDAAHDDTVEAILLIGEVGGDMEERTALLVERATQSPWLPT